MLLSTAIPIVIAAIVIVIISRGMFIKPIIPRIKKAAIKFGTIPMKDKATFLKDYKGASASVSVRKLFFIQLVNWVDEMESIIEQEWDKGDYSKLFPIASPFPYKLCQYLAGMLTVLKDEITALTENAILNKSNDNDNRKPNLYS